jgi:hypothetical protein
MNNKISKEFRIKGQLKNYAFEAVCVDTNVHIKIDIAHWGGNYGSEVIPIGNHARLSEYLSNEALEEVKEYAKSLSETEEHQPNDKELIKKTEISEMSYDNIARIDLVFQILKKYKQEDSLHLFKQIGNRITLTSPFTKLTFEKAIWQIGPSMLSFNEKVIEPFLIDELKNLIKFTELYETKTSLLLEIEINTNIILVQIDKFLGEIIAVKLA